MAAQDEDDTLTSWFMCELCKKPFSDQDQYNLHLESHKADNVKQLVHTCSITDNVDTADFKCSLCDKQFASICTLHDHISICFRSGSYIFSHLKRTAYPLSKFCSLYENRGKVKDGCGENVDKSSLDNSEVILDGTLSDSLEKFLHAIEEEDNKQKSDIDADTTNFDSETDVESDNYLSKEDFNKTPSIESEIRTSKKKKRKRNNSTGECAEENTKKEVNGACKKRGRPRKRENDHNSTGECAEENTKKEVNGTCKKRGRPKKGENDPSVKNVKKRGQIIRKVSCGICGKEYPPAKMKIHMSSHSDDKPFVCDLCPKAYKIQYNLTVHKMSHDSVLKMEGSNGRLRQCEICDKVILPGRSMKLHMISHSDQRAYTCDLCPRTFKYEGHLATHKKSHDSVLPHYCEVCGKGFIALDSLRRHLMKHRNERPYSCSQCDASFGAESSLKRHMIIHTGKKQAQCDTCGKDFATKDRLMSHVKLVHKRELRFECSQCGQKFFTNYNLKCHTMMHGGIKPYKCSMCSAAFIQRKELRRHMKIKHNLTLENGKPGSDLNYGDTTVSVNETKTAVVNISNTCRTTIKNVASVSQSIPAVSSNGDNKQGTSRNDGGQLEQPRDPSYVLVKTEPFQRCGSGGDSESVPFVICPLDNQSGEVVYFSSAADAQIIETEVQIQDDSTLI